MGRHSVPDGHTDEHAGAPSTTADRPLPGRHSRGDAPEAAAGPDVMATATTGTANASGTAGPSDASPQSHTAQIEPIVDPVLDGPGSARAATGRGRQSSTKTTSGHPESRVSDLALLRADSAARARVIAAIIVPFLLYLGVLLVLNVLDLRTALIWSWVPLVSAGVAAGLLLDLAHRAAAARTASPREHATEGQ